MIMASVMKELKYKAAPILTEGPEVPLLLKVDCQERQVTDAMEEFVENLYLRDFARHFGEDDSNEGENEVDCDIIDIISEEDSSDENK